ncbi:hypothetical protein T231_02650 [Tannerella sp. oral taxon BU063 isolate Cell 6/7/9]|uniref:Uncharacterized protein n=1 Tax=Tannerella sp. oral taxon BU063 isolate Cell 6/7/9 TaxID=1411021 RepID=W2CWP5_9BACT|nr:hypothetical protein T231_02650 [Tannerella sp. oral taxon BU063 isolate Cell 6/7/9]
MDENIGSFIIQLISKQKNGANKAIYMKILPKKKYGFTPCKIITTD